MCCRYIKVFNNIFSNNERNAIEPILEDSNKLCFSIFNSRAEAEYKNIIQMNSIPNQLFTLVLNYFFQQSSDYVIVYDSSFMYILIIN